MRVHLLNKLNQGIDGVWASIEERRPFNYSDGESAEKNLFQALSSTNDLSSGSKDLQKFIVDWPSEYHLSPSRSNLLKCLDLSRVKRVLELGCGCGSITRYLAEHSHIEVDAVEGSEVRAGLARMRCRDLENVEVIAANFNDLQIAENHYDLVLFVGVTEYAGRFSSNVSDQGAVVELLNMAQRGLTENGLAMVAIENRLGMKYLLGAHEDHSAKSYVGLERYQNTGGIRTYDRSEWAELVDESGFTEHAFLYPYPDYKLPAIIHSDSVSGSRLAQAMSKVRSRDYTSYFKAPDNEHRLWQGLVQAGVLGEFANSFMLLLSDSRETIEANSAFSLVEYPNFTPDYLSDAARSSKPSDLSYDQNQINRLQAEIQRLQTHSASLEQKNKLMSRSIGWRFLNLFRRAFGRHTY